MQLSVLLALLPAILAAPAVEKRAEPAPLLTPRGVDVVADKYIVKFKDGIARIAVDESMNILESKADFVYETAFRGFAGHLTKAELQTLRNHPDVSVFPETKTKTKNAISSHTDGERTLPR